MFSETLRLTPLNSQNARQPAEVGNISFKLELFLDFGKKEKKKKLQEQIVTKLFALPSQELKYRPGICLTFLTHQKDKRIIEW